MEYITKTIDGALLILGLFFYDKALLFLMVFTVWFIFALILIFCKKCGVVDKLKFIFVLLCPLCISFFACCVLQNMAVSYFANSKVFKYSPYIILFGSIIYSTYNILIYEDPEEANPFYVTAGILFGVIIIAAIIEFAIFVISVLMR